MAMMNGMDRVNAAPRRVSSIRLACCEREQQGWRKGGAKRGARRAKGIKKSGGANEC